MEIKSSLVNDKSFEFVKASLINVSQQDGKEKFRVKMLEYINDTADNDDDEFFYDMLNHVRFLDPGTDAVAFTDENTLIWLNAPDGGGVGESVRIWDFIYDHECLHQLWDTFGVRDKLVKNGIEYNHMMLNIASDCVINDYLVFYRKKTGFPNGIYPEYLKDNYGIIYDRKKDTQYTLYLKLLNKAKELEKDKKLQDATKEFEGKIKPKSVNKQQGGGGGPQGSGNNHSEDYIKGWTDAIQDTLDKKIDPTKDKPKKTGNKEYDKGYSDAIDQIKQGLEDGVTMSSSSGGGNAPGSDLPEIPWETDSDDQQSGGSGEGKSNDSKDSKSSDSSDNNSSDKSSNSSDSKDPDKKAQEAADKAKESAAKAQAAADKAKEDAKKSSSGSGDDKNKKDGEGSGGDKQKDAKEAQDAADKAKEAAKDAQEAADKAKESMNKGDKKGAEQAAKDAQDAANKAEAEAAKANKSEGQSNQQNSNGQPQGKPQHGNEGGGTLVESAEDLKKIKEEGQNSIKKYQSKISGDLGNFIKQCTMSVNLKKSGLMMEGTRKGASVAWNQQMNTYIKAYVKNKVFQKQREFKRTYQRIKRGSGFVEYGSPIERGKKLKNDKLLINVAFYVDRSGSMGNSIDNVFKALYFIAEALKKQFGKEKVVSDVDFKVYAFDMNIQEIQYGKKCQANGGTMAFHQLLDNIVKRTKDYMINVILTDAGFDVVPSEVEKFLKDIEGCILFVTNIHSNEMQKLAEKHKTQLFYVDADANFTVDT